LCKNLKGLVKEIYTNEQAYLYLLKMLVTVDDTILLKNSILSELKEDLYSVCTDKHGKFLILSILCGLDKKYFSPQIRKLLEPTLIPSSENPEVLVPSSKKDPDIRRNELLEYILNDLIIMAKENMQSLMENNSLSINILKEILLKSDETQRSELIDIVINLVDIPYNEVNEEETLLNKTKMNSEHGVNQSTHVLNHPICHRLLKQLIKETNFENTSFALKLFEKIKNSLLGYTLNYFSSWVVLGLLENKDTALKCKEILKENISIIKNHGIEIKTILNEQNTNNKEKKVFVEDLILSKLEI